MRPGTGAAAPRWVLMAADPPGTDPSDQDPRERDLRRRAGEGGAMSPWLIVGGIALLGLAAYVVFALL